MWPWCHVTVPSAIHRLTRQRGATSAIMVPNGHGILAERSPSGPPLPQDLSRTRTQLVSHLLGHKQTQTNYVAQRCQRTHHFTSPLQQRPLLQLRVHQTGPRSRCQNFQGLSPRSGQLFPSDVLRPHTSGPWEPVILASTQRHFVDPFVMSLLAVAC